MPRHHHHHHHHYYGDGGRGREGYAFHAGEPGPGPNRHRIYRNTRTGRIAGVCAGLADYFGWRVGHVRAGLILLTVFFFPMPIFAYIAAAILIKPDAPIAARYVNAEEERFWRTYSVKPRATLSELKHRFRALDARLADMEKAVTSNEYSLRREFRDLEGRA